MAGAGLVSTWMTVSCCLQTCFTTESVEYYAHLKERPSFNISHYRESRYLPQTVLEEVLDKAKSVPLESQKDSSAFLL